MLFPIAHLERQWPGGPVKGTFTARYGPDNRFLESFTLTAPNEDGVPAMLDQALKRFDDIYTRALNAGTLRPDPTLRADKVTLNPAVAALIDAEKQASAQEAAGAAADAAVAVPAAAPTPAPSQQAASSHVVQFVTPDAAAVDAILATVRGTAGVRGAATSSIAIGGVSVMRVSYAGDLGALAAALRARGFRVNQVGNALSISR